MNISWRQGWQNVAKLGVLVILSLILGCAATLSKLVGGGEIVDANYSPSKVLVTYKPVLLDGKEITHRLIDTGKGSAIYETSPGEMGSVTHMHWEDAENDYYGSYIGRRDAWRYVVPKDRSKVAMRYQYGFRPTLFSVVAVNGGFEIDTVNEVKQVIPKDPTAAIPMILTPIVEPVK